VTFLTNELLAQARILFEAAKAKGAMIAFAESCTGGLAAAYVTAIPGSSAVLERGFVTYSNEAKSEMLGVPAALISAHGAVSKAVAGAMAEGALAHSRADIAVSITGIAGPDGGSAEKPVGLVYFAGARLDRQTIHAERRFGAIGRDAVRAQSVAFAFDLALQQLV